MKFFLFIFLTSLISYAESYTEGADLVLESNIPAGATLTAQVGSHSANKSVSFIEGAEGLKAGKTIDKPGKFERLEFFMPDSSWGKSGRDQVVHRPLFTFTLSKDGKVLGTCDFKIAILLKWKTILGGRIATVSSIDPTANGNIKCEAKYENAGDHIKQIIFSVSDLEL